MAGEKLQQVREAMAAMNRGDFELGVAALHEDVEWYPSEEWIGERVYRGHAGVLSVWRMVDEIFDEYRWDIDDGVEEGDHVVCAVRWRGSGKASGASVDRTLYIHWEFRDGKVVLARTFGSMDEALADAGVRR